MSWHWNSSRDKAVRELERGLARGKKNFSLDGCLNEIKMKTIYGLIWYTCISNSEKKVYLLFLLAIKNTEERSTSARSRLA